MLNIVVPEREFFNEEIEEFVYTKTTTLCLEHSLVSLSKWESKWCKPFLSTERKTAEETLDYIRCMTITQNVNPMVFRCLTPDNIAEVSAYINAPMTATWFSKTNKASHSKKIVTSELIYYWMITLNIPMECQKWHLNRLLTLIQVCNEENNPKKMSKNERLAQQNKLNKARREQLNTKG